MEQQKKNQAHEEYLIDLTTEKGRDKTIKYIKQLSDNEKKIFISEKILKKCEFTKEEFYSYPNNFKIKFLCELNKELEEESKKEKFIDLCKLSEEGNESAINIMNILDEIRNDLDGGKIYKKDLEKFLKLKGIKSNQINQMDKFDKSNEEEVKEKLSVISLVLYNYNPDIKYEEYKKNIIDMNHIIQKLIYIKDSLMIFHRNIFMEDIRKIVMIIEEIENGQIIKIRNEAIMKKVNQIIEKHTYLCETINKVKDFLLFKKIFENSRGEDRFRRFEDAIQKLQLLKEIINKNQSNIEIIFDDNNFEFIFRNIKEELYRKNEYISDLFIEQMKDYFNIKDTSIINDLKILIKSKRYENNIKSIKYFFEICLNKKLQLPRDINLSQLKLENLKNILKELKINNIYDYESSNSYYKVFTALYEKKEAIDFLLKYINTDINILRNQLKNKMNPINRTISIKDIEDTIKCLTHLQKFINKNVSEILDYIKLLSEEDISKFVNYSKKYSFIIELDNNYEKDNFEEIYEIVHDANLVFNIDNEDFCYKTFQGEIKKIENIVQLINLKNKILPIRYEKNFINKNLIEINEDPSKIKYDKLLFFENIISNLEILYDIVNVLRDGFNVPIDINIKIQYPKVSYLLNNKIKSINEIKDYMFKIKNDFENQLNEIYETKKYLRFLYGKLFRIIRKHQEGYIKIPDIQRYILNKTNFDDKIEESKNFYYLTFGEDIEHMILINEKIFDGISNYLIGLFLSNGIDCHRHIGKMEIKDNNKGISVVKCLDQTIEEYVLYLFVNNLDKLPISQNILVCNNETSIEEIKSFLYRAILCEFRTLFVIELLESFPDAQFNKMLYYIDKILSIKYEKYLKKNNEKNIKKEESNIYLDSFIVFVYNNIENEFINTLNKYTKKDDEIENEFINTLNKYTKKDDEIENEIIGLNLSNISNGSIEDIQVNELLKNIKVKIITSDVCGLGKSFKIKKMIREEGKKYYHFLLGGKLTKKEIYQKIKELLEKIKKEFKTNSKDKKNNNDEYKEFNNVAIHLDLIETEEISLINEFLFSFLITRFYIYNENIIYIPNNFKLYIEIPNSQNNYLKQFGILNLFNKENIELGHLLPLLELEADIRNKFKILVGIETNEKIEKFIKVNFNKIGINEYSYYQIQIFIKLFFSQFDFQNKNITITKECLDYFFNSLKYFIKGGFYKFLINKNKKDNYIYGLLEAYENDFNYFNFEYPLIYIDNNTIKLFDLYEDKYQKEKIKKINKDVDRVYLIDTYKYLNKFKQLLNIPNDLENDMDNNRSLLSILGQGIYNYVITDDNYKKMILLYYRLKANIPVIIMGETGCGKTSLIIKLSQFLNNGEKLVEIINIYPGITDEEIIDFIREMNMKSKKLKSKKKELWVLFDGINTCLSSIVVDIFVNRTINGVKLEDNIRLIGACNPYREKINNLRIYENDDYDEYYDDDRLVYKVKQIPESLLYYAFSFGSLRDEDEKIYIKSIIQKLFYKDEDKLCDLTTKAISICHIFLRNYNDPSVVSLRDISRFTKCAEFFQDYFLKKNNQSEFNLNDESKKLYKIKSIICSIYICYYLRLTEERQRADFETRLQNILLEIVNVYNPEDNEHECGNLFSKIKNRKLSIELSSENFNRFSDLLRIEEEFLIEQIELDRSINKSQLLKDKLFLLFLSVVTKIPFIIIGKPGTGKSLAVQLIYNSMRGKYSKTNFFKQYPKIIQIYYKCSELTTSQEITEIFIKGEDLYYNYRKTNINNEDLVPIYMILFDDIHLANKAISNPIIVLQNKIEYDGKTEGICFIGISNYSLNSTLMNRTFVLSIPNLENKLDQLELASKDIVRNISDNDYDNLIFNILSRAYFKYKHILIFIKQLMVLKKYAKNKDKKILKQKCFGEIVYDIEYIKLFKKDKRIKTEFHGVRDFYNLIKGVALDGLKLLNISDEKQIVPIINNYIERNFGGISYEINIDFTLEFEDIKDEMEELKNEILNLDKNKTSKDNIFKVNSVYLFKKIYNKVCLYERNDKYDGKFYQILKDDLIEYNINRCLFDNINDNNSRNLLLGINPNLSSFIIQNIRMNNSDKENIEIINGSPFIDDNNYDYKIKKANEILNLVSQRDELIILQNLDCIQPYLYDLYNMNYKIIDDQKCVKISLDNFNEQFYPVNDTFKIIVLVNKKFMNTIEDKYLKLFEKMQINFNDLLDYNLKELIKNIIDEIKLKDLSNKIKYNINYDLNNLLINCNSEEIGALVYYLNLEAKSKKKTENNNEIKEIIYNKMSILLPEDIIILLSEENPLKEKYYKNKKYYNFKKYMNDLISNNIYSKNYKISIIYTFSNIMYGIKVIKQGIFMPEIKTEEELMTRINYIRNINKVDNNKNFILIHFEDIDSDKLQYVVDIINYYYRNDEYHYILVIYINRNFNLNKNEGQIIYSIPNIYNNINQLFIDNLDGPEITLDSLLNKTVKEFLSSENNYSELCSFLKYQIYFMNKGNNRDEIKAKEFIESNKDFQGNCYSLINKMLQDNYININSVDIISSLLDYIKNNIFIKYFNYVFNISNESKKSDS